MWYKAGSLEPKSHAFPLCPENVDNDNGFNTINKTTGSFSDVYYLSKNKYV